MHLFLVLKGRLFFIFLVALILNLLLQFSIKFNLFHAISVDYEGLLWGLFSLSSFVANPNLLSTYEVPRFLFFIKDNFELLFTDIALSLKWLMVNEKANLHLSECMEPFLLWFFTQKRQSNQLKTSLTNKVTYLLSDWVVSFLVRRNLWSFGTKVLIWLCYLYV